MIHKCLQNDQKSCLAAETVGENKCHLDKTFSIDFCYEDNSM